LPTWNFFTSGQAYGKIDVSAIGSARRTIAVRQVGSVLWAVTYGYREEEETYQVRIIEWLGRHLGLESIFALLGSLLVGLA